MISPNEVASALRAYVRETSGPARPSKTGRSQGGPPSGGAASPPADPVSLSPRAAEVARWLAQIRSLPDVRPDRVAEVVQRMQSGQYPPPAGEVADKILSRWLVNP
jgi:negative regulator of flagellin synthesis FlgM